MRMACPSRQYVFRAGDRHAFTLMLLVDTLHACLMLGSDTTFLLGETPRVGCPCTTLSPCPMADRCPLVEARHQRQRRFGSR
jgi:hypothetical protein